MSTVLVCLMRKMFVLNIKGIATHILNQPYNAITLPFGLLNWFIMALFHEKEYNNRSELIN